MEDEWHETAFTTKHIPHHMSKSHTKKISFDVRKLFGRYEIKCPSASAPSKEPPNSNRRKTRKATIEMFRLSDDGDGVLGHITLPGTLEAEIVLSGSRKTLNTLISKLNGTAPSSPDSVAEIQHGLSADRPSFEKNSFRVPKFWLRYKSTSDSNDTGTGYLIFSGNDCRRFRGTLSSEARGWDNFAVSGWKAVWMSERDVSFQWGERDGNSCQQGDRDVERQVESSS
ncbi:Fc.00g021660.m01.CDS01 [Cosmosporella sp. VM-42]